MNKDNEMLDLLIIGGGIHGMYLFHLISCLTENTQRIKIADPHPEPLRNWQHCTSNTGMEFLRSPGVHHIDVDPFSLHKFCESHPSNHTHSFTTPNKRPTLDLFNNHSKKVLSDYSIQNYWLQARIRDIELSEDGAVVFTDHEKYHTKHIILAIGSGGQLTIPNWAQELEKQEFPVHHIYSHDFSVDSFTPGFHTVVIGGGMGAVQTFNKIANKQHHTCTLISSHPISTSQYDVEPGWMGPKKLSRFNKQGNYRQRRRMIQSSRKSSSITPEVNNEFKQSLTADHTNHIIGKVKKAEIFGSESAYLTLENGESVFCDNILLGTGFDPVINNQLIQKVKQSHSLRCAECGYPIVDPFLRWHPHFTVTGELAELELGPAAKQIIGARHAGERIRHVF